MTNHPSFLRDPRKHSLANVVGENALVESVVEELNYAADDLPVQNQLERRYSGFDGREAAPLISIVLAYVAVSIVESQL